ncbi:MAG: GtrA family protein [Salinibacterium sp.]|nr:MAG: GtrA family protein [Salinibacterium sp.]
MRRLLAQFARFGAVGAVGLVIDVSLFNLLRATILDPAVVAEGPLLAKVISTAVAILANWVGNRYWAFANERRARVLREGVQFVLVSLGGMVIGVACLWFSRHVLGQTSVAADNISSNVIGLGLGTAFRFLLYRSWVFKPTTVRAPLRAPETSVDPAG